MKIKKNDAYFLLLLPFFEPKAWSELSAFGYVHQTVQIWKTVAYLVLAIILIKAIAQNRVKNTLIIPVAIFYLTFLVYPIINNKDITEYIVFAYDKVAFMTALMICYKSNTKELINKLHVLYTLLIVVNLVLIILYPSGLNNSVDVDRRIHFLANDNALLLYTLPCCYFALLNKRKKYLAILNIIVSAITTVIIWSATAVICITAFLTLSFVIMHSKRDEKLLSRLLNLKNLTILYVTLSIVVVLFNSQNGLFSFIIESVLHKNINYSTRTVLWKNAIASIALSPLYGHGFYENSGAHILVHGTHQDWYATSHNEFLEILVRGGFISFVVYILIIGKMFFKRKIEGKYQLIMTIAVFTVWIYFMMEVSFSEYISYIFYFFFMQQCVIYKNGIAEERFE